MGGESGDQTPVSVLFVTDDAGQFETIRLAVGATEFQLHQVAATADVVEAARNVSPNVLLLSMAAVKQSGLLEAIRAASELREVPRVVIADVSTPHARQQLFERGISDILPNEPTPIELVSRLRYHQTSYQRLLERNRALAKLDEERNTLARELNAARKDVQRFLPKPATEPVQFEWCQLPCVGPAGDIFDFRILDKEHVAFYLLDVAGHGPAAAILAVIMMFTIRSRTSSDLDAKDPGAVLDVLNDIEYGDKFTTMWYGVLNLPERRLRWSSAGHNATLVGSTGKPQTLNATHPPLSVCREEPIQASETTVDPGTTIWLYSDGVYEWEKSDGRPWGQDALHAFLAQHNNSPTALTDIQQHVKTLNGGKPLDDDFTLIRVRAPE